MTEIMHHPCAVQCSLCVAPRRGWRPVVVANLFVRIFSKWLDTHPSMQVTSTKGGYPKKSSLEGVGYLKHLNHVGTPDGLWLQFGPWSGMGLKPTFGIKNAGCQTYYLRDTKSFIDWWVANPLLRSKIRDIQQTHKHEQYLSRKTRPIVRYKRVQSGPMFFNA